MADQLITAIYRAGVLKPLQPLQLAENEQVKIRILHKQMKSTDELLTLSGIWHSLGDPTYAEIEAITHDAHAKSLQSLLLNLGE